MKNHSSSQRSTEKRMPSAAINANGLSGIRVSHLPPLFAGFEDFEGWVEGPACGAKGRGSPRTTSLGFVAMCAGQSFSESSFLKPLVWTLTTS